MARGVGMVSLIATLALSVSAAAAPEPAPTPAGREVVVMAREISYQAETLRDPLKSLLPPPPPPPPPPQAQGGRQQQEVQISPPAATLQGMLWGGQQPRAIINGDVYKLGDTVAGSKIVAIDRQGVTVEISGKQFVLTPTKVTTRGPGQGYSAARQSVPATRAR